VLQIDADQLKSGRLSVVSDDNISNMAQIVSSGTVASDHHVVIVDIESGKQVRNGVVGEICVCGPSVTKGYVCAIFPIV
jgi:acyl-CoA synthetase (AMP-forming)/AMP-acid ligase II